jgi:hypothetical protein
MKNLPPRQAAPATPPSGKRGQLRGKLKIENDKPISSFRKEEYPSKRGEVVGF